MAKIDRYIPGPRISRTGDLRLFPEDELKSFIDVAFWKLNDVRLELYKEKIAILNQTLQESGIENIESSATTTDLPDIIEDYLKQPDNKGICTPLNILYLASQLWYPSNFALYFTVKDKITGAIIPKNMIVGCFVGSCFHVIAFCTNNKDSSFKGGGEMINLLKEFCVRANIPYITLYSLRTTESYYIHHGFTYAERIRNHGREFLTDINWYPMDTTENYGNKAMIWRNNKFRYDIYDSSGFSNTRELYFDSANDVPDILLNKHVNNIIFTVKKAGIKFLEKLGPRYSSDVSVSTDSSGLTGWTDEIIDAMKEENEHSSTFSGSLGMGSPYSPVESQLSPLSMTSSPPSSPIRPLSMTSSPQTSLGTPLSMTSSSPIRLGTPLSMTSSPQTSLGTPLSMTSSSPIRLGTPLSLEQYKSDPESYLPLFEPLTEKELLSRYFFQKSFPPVLFEDLYSDLPYNHLNLTPGQLAEITHTMSQVTPAKQFPHRDLTFEEQSELDAISNIHYSDLDQEPSKKRKFSGGNTRRRKSKKNKVSKKKQTRRKVSRKYKNKK